ncbi:hypothetical protein CR513_40088, partial [Mucuna pruriens]
MTSGNLYLYLKTKHAYTYPYTFVLNLDEFHKKVDQIAYRDTTNLGLHFKKSNEYKLVGYYDVDYARDKIERKSTN